MKKEQWHWEKISEVDSQLLEISKVDLQSIEEKSLGCIHKSGTAPFQGVLQYADIPTEKGLSLWILQDKILNQ